MTFSEEFKDVKNPAIKVIGEYLMTRDDLKEKLENPKKSLKEMFSYITSEAKKKAEGNCACISDEEVFGWAVHYYDEENLEFKPVKESVKVKTSKTKSDSASEEKKVKKPQERLMKEKKEREEKELNKIMETPNIVLNPKKKKEVIVEGQLSIFEVM